MVPDSNPSEPVTQGARVPAPPGAPSRVTPVSALALLVGALALALTVYDLRRAPAMEQRLAQQQSAADSQLRREADLDKRIATLQERLDALEQDSGGVGAASDPELRHRREVFALVDAERLVEQAQLQLRLGAPTQVVLEALAVVDARLARIPGPAVARVQTSLRRDLARVRAAPDVDRGALAARLDPLLLEVDSWHASADAARPAAPQRREAPGAAKIGTSAPAPEGWGARIRTWLSTEFGEYLRIREIDTPEALLLGPSQQQLLRERVRLGILSLREAVLARDERTVRAEQGALETLLTRYFDPNQPSVASAIDQLRAVAAASVAGAPPNLDETLAALRAARGRAEAN